MSSTMSSTSLEDILEPPLLGEMSQQSSVRESLDDHRHSFQKDSETKDTHTFEKQCSKLGPSSLPDEILAEIFLHTASLRHSNQTSPPVDCCSPDVLTTDDYMLYTPWLINQVCHRWRSIVSRLTKLWAHITILPRPHLKVRPSAIPTPFLTLPDPSIRIAQRTPDLENSRRSHADAYVRLLRAILPSEGEVGLHIRSITAYPDRVSEYVSTYANLIKCLIPMYGHRITALTLALSPSFLIDGMHALFGLDASLFRSIKMFELELTIRHSSLLEPLLKDVTKFRPFSEAKALRTLSLRVSGDLKILRFFEGCCIPWSQIQHLTLVIRALTPDEGTIPDVLRILESCDQLIELRLGVWGRPSVLSGRIEGNRWQMVQLSTLVSLILEVDFPLQYIATPSLRRLQIHTEYTDSHMRSEIIPFLRRSNPPLEDFDDQGDLPLTECPIQEDRVLTPRMLGDNLLHIRRLRLGYPLDTRDIADIVKGNMFPNLVNLHCQSEQPTQPSQLITILREAFTSQAEQAPPLRRRFFRVFSDISAQNNEKHISTFESEAENLLCSTGIELECLSDELDDGHCIL